MIDDDAIMRDLIGDWLEAAGYAVRKALDCRGGLAEVESRVPALVVSDLWMPGSRGVEAIRWLRQKHPDVAVIAISARFGSPHGCSEREALQAGAARAIAKPARRADLLAAVAALIGPPAK